MTKVPLTANNSTPPTQAHQDAAPYPIRGDPGPLPCAAPMPQRLRIQRDELSVASRASR